MPPFIEVDGLTKFYGEHAVIRGLSLSIHEGEVVLFQGPSGIGKSTFLRCLTYLEPFQKGTVRVGDQSLAGGVEERRQSATVRAIRRRLGFVFQFFNLFPHLTVMQNITLGPVKVLGLSPEEAESDAMRLLKRVGLEHKAGARPGALSGGQQQRVGIARSLAMRPRAVLFDEPISSLDAAMKGEIVQVMEDFAHDGLTMLIVTHETAPFEPIVTRTVEFGPLCSVVSDKTQTRMFP
jgi:polar amino acid transport system ATP-binding protein